MDDPNLTVPQPSERAAPSDNMSPDSEGSSAPCDLARGMPLDALDDSPSASPLQRAQEVASPVTPRLDQAEASGSSEASDTASEDGGVKTGTEEPHSAPATAPTLDADTSYAAEPQADDSNGILTSAPIKVTFRDNPTVFHVQEEVMRRVFGGRRNEHWPLNDQGGVEISAFSPVVMGTLIRAFYSHSEREADLGLHGMPWCDVLDVYVAATKLGPHAWIRIACMNELEDRETNIPHLINNFHDLYNSGDADEDARNLFKRMLMCQIEKTEPTEALAQYLARVSRMGGEMTADIVQSVMDMRALDMVTHPWHMVQANNGFNQGWGPGAPYASDPTIPMAPMQSTGWQEPLYQHQDASNGWDHIVQGGGLPFQGGGNMLNGNDGPIPMLPAAHPTFPQPFNALGPPTNTGHTRTQTAFHYSGSSQSQINPALASYNQRESNQQRTQLPTYPPPGFPPHAPQAATDQVRMLYIGDGLMHPMVDGMAYGLAGRRNVALRDSGRDCSLWFRSGDVIENVIHVAPRMEAGPLGMRTIEYMQGICRGRAGQFPTSYVRDVDFAAIQPLGSPFQATPMQANEANEAASAIQPTYQSNSPVTEPVLDEQTATAAPTATATATAGVDANEEEQHQEQQHSCGNWGCGDEECKDCRGDEIEMGRRGQRAV